MAFNTPFIQDFMRHFDYPKEAIDLFTEVLDRIDNNKTYNKIFSRCVEQFKAHHSRIEDKVLNQMFILAKLMGYKYYTLYFVYVLSFVEDLKKQYLLLGIDEQIYYDTMADLKYKLLECMECRGVPGTFVAGWFDGFMHLNRIAYGRFQYEVSTYTGDDFTLSSGRVLKNGDIFIGFHIPSSGVPLTDEVRMASYKEAYKRFKHLFPDGNVLFGCGSWLLYPRHKEFLPENMNILKFMSDFEIVHWKERDDFHDGWRVFGKDAKLPVEKLPRDTKLKKAYAEWLEAGNKAGDAFGVILFDGEKIVR